MTGTTKKCKQGIIKDICGDPSTGQKVYAYLEGRMTDEEAEMFVAHVEKCPACLEIIVWWHYQSVVEEIEVSAVPDNELETIVWDWPLGVSAQGNTKKSDLDAVNSENKSFH